ncbi:deoxyribodipyrimidine photo-lyase [Hortaea werneckii]|nr:deoxyribodipyrimidine photo-lyase [Hortaea werneckii]KAI7061561.1 deoxyribodipyrimidine photo-lyase [Hortaea werneckii]KAI7207647.1 deoxyribodipyrimidine photo-lyase [Hortaea werneckii]KAI7290761.1 deoxyribodipyrimidine photo-lyase [Hortaea werneckii]KAI7375429.1 deoxyribodipyrimidine photo-lyase [Hortaea werneckii]
MAPKRRATSPTRPSPRKKRETSNEANGPAADLANDDDPPNFIQRQFYPPEMGTNAKDTKSQREQVQVGNAVVHWFKRDLRTYDNRALSAASAKAKEHQVPLICLFVVSPEDYQAHLISPARVDFELRTLQVLKADLAEKAIPLEVATIPSRKDVPGHIIRQCQGWGAKHVYCNIEYEVDELRRETKLTKTCLDNGIAFTAMHDDVVVPPETLMTGQGKQYSVYSPWYRAWVKHIHSHPHLLSASEPPTSNQASSREQFDHIFSAPVPSAPANKSLNEDEKQRLTHLWPAGEHEAQSRLQRFLQEKISRYSDTRNIPFSNSTALLSVHFATGTLSARSAIRLARDANKTPMLDAGNAGIKTWISEIGWRDFYKHILAHWPYISMFKPFKPETTRIRWEYNAAHFGAWCRGQTGFPIVDAAMRQLNSMAYMHNRCRMIVASFLSKDLLLDWRLGEAYFSLHLIDSDLASNNGGWGFSASVGVDPQPYFRIFNPLLQSEKFDPDGEYIRKWVPELRGVTGKAIHDPYGRGQGAAAEKAGYPRPIVEHKKPDIAPALRDHGSLGTKVLFVLLVTTSRDHDFRSLVKSTLVEWPEKRSP